MADIRTNSQANKTGANGSAALGRSNHKTTNLGNGYFKREKLSPEELKNLNSQPVGIALDQDLLNRSKKVSDAVTTVAGESIGSVKDLLTTVGKYLKDLYKTIMSDAPVSTKVKKARVLILTVGSVFFGFMAAKTGLKAIFKLGSEKDKSGSPFLWLAAEAVMAGILSKGLYNTLRGKSVVFDKMSSVLKAGIAVLGFKGLNGLYNNKTNLSKMVNGMAMDPTARGQQEKNLIKRFMDTFSGVRNSIFELIS